MNITIEDLQVSVKLGCSAEERSFPQIVQFDLELRLGDLSSLASDRLEDTVDYMEVISALQTVADEKEFHTVEHLVSCAGTKILELSDKLDSVFIQVRKRVSPLTQSIGFAAEIGR